MPAYTTIACSFDKRDRTGLVRAFYDALLGDDVTFQGVLEWGCAPDLTLDQIVQWNQAKLDKDFILGYHEHVKNDYRQVMLAVEPFSECRLILFNWESGLSFNCIVPEHEINRQNAGAIERACRRVWSRLPVQAIESYGETGADAGPAAIQSGKPPSAQLFALIEYDCKQQDYAQHYTITRMDRGYLLTPNDTSSG